ncbi:NTP transferase domain-containing protein [Dactylosporangium vinaceum]|uniref:NDP-sugar synthase n=1 Tax=Dactylosporangium vinaceum TaxID=53362 RepID=A0ABV5M3G3_9ACTN|nr:sugar phosphate nucleotidyltransferase [Dactylosporangium vinaceum]UAB99777.1 NTP transferase domain-containing protein [Dactylosporangium vinaceum]
MHAVIMAGGKGVRLRPFTTALPKPLMPIGERHAILGIVLEQLAARGFGSVTLCINHHGPLIHAFVGDGSRWGLEVGYAEETVPLSTAGPLFLVKDLLPEHFLVMNGDLLTDLDYADLLARHRRGGAPLTIATAAQTTRMEFGVLDVVEGRVIGFTEKPAYRHRVSMGIYGMARKTLEPYPPGLTLGFDRLIQDLLRQGEFPDSYDFEGVWLDIGRPEEYDEANRRFGELETALLPVRSGAAA